MGKSLTLFVINIALIGKTTPFLSFSGRPEQFLKPYWQHHVVFEEMPLAGTRLRLDFLNITRNIAIECQGGQHNDFNHYYNEGSRDKFLKQIQRDITKRQWCEKNDLLLVEIFEEDIDKLLPEWFLEKYQITL